MVTILIVGGGIALVLLIIGIVVSTSGNRSLVDDRLNKYLEEEQKNETKKSKTLLTDWVNRTCRKIHFW